MIISVMVGEHHKYIYKYIPKYSYISINSIVTVASNATEICLRTSDNNLKNKTQLYIQLRVCEPCVNLNTLFIYILYCSIYVCSTYIYIYVCTRFLHIRIYSIQNFIRFRHAAGKGRTSKGFGSQESCVVGIVLVGLSNGSHIRRLYIAYSEFIVLVYNTYLKQT